MLSSAIFQFAALGKYVHRVGFGDFEWGTRLPNFLHLGGVRGVAGELLQDPIPLIDTLIFEDEPEIVCGPASLVG